MVQRAFGIVTSSAAWQRSFLDKLLSVFAVLFIATVLVSSLAAGIWTPVHDYQVHHAHVLATGAIQH